MGIEMDVRNYKAEMQAELRSILHFWSTKMVDNEHGGFYGRIDGHNVLHADAEKGGVITARILWSFSAAYNYVREPEYLSMADRAYGYILDHFIDREYGGVYWGVDASGRPVHTRKQIYGQAFAIYALSEYYVASHNKEALEMAVQLFQLIEKYSYDTVEKGYFEAYTREWQPETDLRLSAKDENEKKTMNTHLHVIEAYAALYRVWKDPLLKQQIIALLEVFTKYIIDPATGHLQLFFDEHWNGKSTLQSYGHDIEAAWLLQEVAEIIGEEKWTAEMKKWAVVLAGAASEELDKDGGLWYEKENGHLVRQKHCWPQAEAMVGYLNAFEITGENSYLRRSENSWSFVKKYLLDQAFGEWYWGIYEDHTPMLEEDKAGGYWKCPYHNTRACLEVIRRLH